MNQKINRICWLIRCFMALLIVAGISALIGLTAYAAIVIIARLFMS